MNQGAIKSLINAGLKLFSLVLILSSFFSCAKNSDGQTKAQGGVDVGNMSSIVVSIPQTKVVITVSGNWNYSIEGNTLKITNSNSSSILANRAELTQLTSPNQVGLEKYLESVHPDRDYKPIEYNGMKGVIAEFTDTAGNPQSDIYLISELKDFVHIVGHFNKDDDSASDGNKIISTVRIRYKGTKVQNTSPKTVELKNERKPKGEGDPYNSFKALTSYSLLDDCETNHLAKSNSDTCKGVPVDVAFWKSDNGLVPAFYVGSDGRGGRIIELGPADQIPFDSVFVDDEYLVSPESKTPISDIYSVFTPQNQHIEITYLIPKPNHVYLVRTINWPFEDLIVKIKVNSIDSGKSLNFTYQKLVTVSPDVLQKQVDLINKNTIENEMPLSEGEVTLFNKSIWKNTPYASFNFKFSTSGNQYITNNTWDFSLRNSCAIDYAPQNNKPVLTLNGRMGELFSFGNRKLSEISKSDFPNSGPAAERCGAIIKKGETYGIYKIEQDEATYGAIQVIDMAQDGSWARMKFRRIYIGKPEKIQNWVSLPTLWETHTRIISEEGTSFFYGGFGIQFKTDNAGNKLILHSSPSHKSEGGLYNFGNNLNFEDISLNDIEINKINLKKELLIKLNDTIAIYTEDYENKLVAIIAVDGHELGKSLTIKIKYLYQATVPYNLKSYLPKK
ncbi:MAG: hypothetical protein NDI63_00720 [Pseudobdellovibrio sp.]|nr:hypothetical protein [Pseudobdellovibrio sp.]